MGGVDAGVELGDAHAGAVGHRSRAPRGGEAGVDEAPGGRLGQRLQLTVGLERGDLALRLGVGTELRELGRRLHLTGQDLRTTVAPHDGDVLGRVVVATAVLVTGAGVGRRGPGHGDTADGRRRLRGRGGGREEAAGVAEEDTRRRRPRPLRSPRARTSGARHRIARDAPAEPSTSGPPPKPEASYRARDRSLRARTT